MEVEVAQSLDAEQHFWTGVDNVVTGPSDTYELIDDALRSYLEFTAEHKSGQLLIPRIVRLRADGGQRTSCFRNTMLRAVAISYWMPLCSR
ncbi:hypothetical protein KC352_g27326 [Hortaea werneckii]|nr:hypothetical protein KC352_g27326 [Hortaea werneckii]